MHLSELMQVYTSNSGFFFFFAIYKLHLNFRIIRKQAFKGSRFTWMNLKIIMSNPKSHMLYGSTYTKYTQQTNHWRQKAVEWLPGTRGFRVKTDCLKSMGFFMGVMDMFWSQWCTCVTLDTLKATRLHTLKW